MALRLRPEAIFLRQFKILIMEKNRDVNRNDELRNEDNDQLRPNTMNEAIREVSGNPDADLSKIGTSGSQENRGQSTSHEELHGSNVTLGVSNNPNDMSATRSGGTTDMDDQAMGGAGLANGERLGSGSNITTKRNVTGSDFDGQVKSS